MGDAMTPRGGPLSEKEKVYAICLLFPIFWPFIPVLLICDLCEWIRDKVRTAYTRWRINRDYPDDRR